MQLRKHHSDDRHESHRIVPGSWLERDGENDHDYLKVRLKRVRVIRSMRLRDRTELGHLRISMEHAPEHLVAWLGETRSDQ
jgi:hypothetical protein